MAALRLLLGAARGAQRKRLPSCRRTSGRAVVPRASRPKVWAAKILEALSGEADEESTFAVARAGLAMAGREEELVGGCARRL